jgi:hypothetical protein
VSDEESGLMLRALNIQRETIDVLMGALGTLAARVNALECEVMWHREWPENGAEMDRNGGGNCPQCDS